MEHWPSDERRQRAQDQSQSETKGKTKASADNTNYWRWPHLEHGAIGRATLVSQNGRLQWSTVVDTSRRRTLVSLCKPTKIFPETRPPPVDIGEYSARKRSEQGLHYLRKYFPDADFPAEVVKEELNSEVKQGHNLEAFDPFLANLLEVLPSHPSQDSYTIVFPTGALNEDLNVSPLERDPSGNFLFNPSGTPSFTFETPILQVSSPVALSGQNYPPRRALVVRTYTSTSLVHITTDDGETRPTVIRDIDITRSDTGDMPAVDSRVLAAGPDVLLVNRVGQVYKCDTGQGTKAIQCVWKSTFDPSSSDSGQLWQLGITDRDDSCFLAFNKGVKHLDFRSNSAVDIFSDDHSGDIVTAFESPKQDYLSRVSTTADIIWLDDRFRRRPLMSIRHHRSFDRTLSVTTAQLNSGPLSLLMSRQNGLVTLYDVSRATDGLLHCNSTPSCLGQDGPFLRSYTGHAVVVFPSGSELSLLRLDLRGALYRQDARVQTSDKDGTQGFETEHPTHVWSPSVQQLDKRASELQSDHGPVEARHYTEVDLRGAYEKIFAISDGEGDVEDFRDVIDRLPGIWQGDEAPIENMLTTLDVVSRTCEGLIPASRADFLAGPIINAKRDLRVLLSDSLPFRDLANGAAWHYSVQKTSNFLSQSNSDGWPALHERLKEMDLVSDTKRHPVSLQREAEAREQLLVDLALSSDVYSARRLTNVPSEGESHTMFQDTKGRPEVQFGFFRPVRKIGAQHYANAGETEEFDGDTTFSSSPGVRLLLAEWEVGTDPEDYIYEDPYDVADREKRPSPRKRQTLPTLATVTQRTVEQSQRPPTVVATTTEHLPPTQVPRPIPTVTQSQTVQRTLSQTKSDHPETFSQELMTSTQVLPGPFGGRPSVGAKKKPTLKRIGGF